ncbi:MAG: TolC family protein, partial [Pedobacter sp.]
YINSASLAKQRIISSEKQLNVNQNELAKTIRLLYYQAALNKERLKLLTYQDSLYSKFKQAAELRFKTGETAYLETLAANTRLMEIENEIFQAQSDMIIYSGQLQNLLSIEENISIPDTVLDYTWAVTSDTTLLNENPYSLAIVITREQIEGPIIKIGAGLPQSIKSVTQKTNHYH